MINEHRRRLLSEATYHDSILDRGNENDALPNSDVQAILHHVRRLDEQNRQILAALQQDEQRENARNGRKVAVPKFLAVIIYFAKNSLLHLGGKTELRATARWFRNAVERLG